jgi:DNA-binding transcriptional LysR family regulator
MRAKPGLTVHRLELFLAVLDAGGIARAARARHISQPAVSEHVKGLEAHFGVPLFERAGRGVRPTAAARSLEPFARAAVQALRSAEQASRELAGLGAGSLTVGASSTPGTYVLPRLLGRFHARYPGVALTLQIENSRELEHWVAAGRVDLGVIGEAPLLGGLSATPLLKDRLVLIVPRRHRLAKRRVVQSRALIGEALIAREEGSSTRGVAERYFAALGLEFAPVMALGSTEAVREAVAAGLGVAIVSSLTVPRADRRIAALRLAGAAWDRDLLMVERIGGRLGPAATRFREFLIRET